jgi:hypothetical protein
MLRRLRQKFITYWVLWRNGGLARVWQYRQDVKAVKDLAKALRETGR